MTHEKAAQISQQGSTKMLFSSVISTYDLPAQFENPSLATKFSLAAMSQKKKKMLIFISK